MAGIQINLGGNFSKLDELKSKSASAAKSIKSAFGSDIGKKAFAGLAIGATAAFATVVAGMKSAIDAGGELSDMMARTGAEGAKLFVMQRAFENAGLAASQVPTVLNKMQKALAGVNEEGDRVTTRVFNDLNLSLSELQSMDPAMAFRKISEAIANVDDPARRAAMAMEIFGKSAGELLVMMTDSRAFSTAEQQVGELAETLANNANELDYVADAMGLFQVKLQQVGAEVAVSLLPQLTQLSDWVNETDFSAVGGGIGVLAEKTVEWGTALSKVAEYLPMMIAFQKIADMTIGGDLSDEDKKKARAMADQWAANDPNNGKGQDEIAAEKSAAVEKTQTIAEARAAAAEAKKATADAERSAAAAEKKAAADAKAAEEKARSRAAGAEEYRLEKAIIDARLAGDQVRLAALEREKKIREEIARLESAGFSKDEARKPATAKVDAEKKAADKDAARKQAQDEKSRLQETLAGKVNDSRGKLDDLQYQSSVGSISSMQRIGGGGGAVGSGLDYARQAADLQREANNYLRELIEVSRREVDV